MPFVSGLDLGQAADYTALAACEQTEGPDPLHQGGRAWYYAVRHLERYPLGTPYVGIPGQSTGVGEAVKALMQRAPLIHTPLSVDQTGVGRAVVDMLRALAIPCQLAAVTITAGEQTTRDEQGDWHVPKRELVGTLQTLLQCGRLKVAKALPLASVLESELTAFRVKQSRSGHESFEAWREKDHDDVVLAVALACWLGERTPTARWAASTPSR
jgi:hypothetical protein